MLTAVWCVTTPAIRLLARRRRMPTRDRALLERTIFRALFVDPSVRRILFVGCSRFTSWYAWLFLPRRSLTFATVDPDPAAARYGARRHHRVARFQALADDPAMRGVWDAVILNGVFGYGIDTDKDKRASLQVAATLLRPGGVLVVGYRAGAYGDLAPKLVDAAAVEPGMVPGCKSHSVAAGTANEHTFGAWHRP